VEQMLIVHGGYHLDTILTIFLKNSRVLLYLEFAIFMTGAMIIIAMMAIAMNKGVTMMNIADGKTSLVNQKIV
jgi:hypothetical protein